MVKAAFSPFITSEMRAPLCSVPEQMMPSSTRCGAICHWMGSVRLISIADADAPAFRDGVGAAVVGDAPAAAFSVAAVPLVDVAAPAAAVSVAVVILPLPCRYGALWCAAKRRADCRLRPAPPIIHPARAGHCRPDFSGPILVTPASLTPGPPAARLAGAYGSPF